MIDYLQLHLSTDTGWENKQLCDLINGVLSSTRSILNCRGVLVFCSDVLWLSHLVGEETRRKSVITKIWRYQRRKIQTVSWATRREYLKKRSSVPECFFVFWTRFTSSMGFWRRETTFTIISLKDLWATWMKSINNDAISCCQALNSAALC